MTFWRALDAASAKRTISGKGGFLIPRRKGEKRDALDTGIGSYRLTSHAQIALAAAE